MAIAGSKAPLGGLRCPPRGPGFSPEGVNDLLRLINPTCSDIVLYELGVDMTAILLLELVCRWVNKKKSRACTVEDSTLFCFFGLFDCSQFSFFGLCVQYLFRVGMIAILLLEPVCRWVNKSIFLEHAQWEILPFFFGLFACLQFSLFGLCVQCLFRVGTIASLLLEPVCRWVNKSVFPEHAHWEIIPFFVSLFFWFVHQNPLPCP